MAHLLQFITCIDTSLSPKVYSLYSLVVVGLETFIITCIYHSSIVQCSFTTLNLLYALNVYFSLPLSCWKPLIFLLSP
jgi:ABC-type molybdate transport system permease subunit